MTAAPVFAPPVAPLIEHSSVPFQVIHSDVVVSCDQPDMNFQCAAGYEEPARSWLPDDVAENHICFQAAGVPYTVTIFKRQECSECDYSLTDCIHNADAHGTLDSESPRCGHRFGFPLYGGRYDFD